MKFQMFVKFVFHGDVSIYHRHFNIYGVAHKMIMNFRVLFPRPSKVMVIKIIVRLIKRPSSSEKKP